MTDLSTRRRLSRLGPNLVLVAAASHPLDADREPERSESGAPRPATKLCG